MANEGSGSERKRRAWRREVERWQRSGESIRAFCARRGLSEPSFYWWRRRLGAGRSGRRGSGSESGSRPSPQPGFAEVQVTGEAGPTAAGMIELTLPTGEQLRIGPGVDAMHLQRVLAAVRAGHAGSA